MCLQRDACQNICSAIVFAYMLKIKETINFPVLYYDDDDYHCFQYSKET